MYLLKLWNRNKELQANDLVIVTIVTLLYLETMLSALANTCAMMKSFLSKFIYCQVKKNSSLKTFFLKL